MVRTLQTVAAALTAAMLLTACGGADDEARRAVTTSGSGITRVAAVSSVAKPTPAVRGAACEDMLPKLANMQVQDPAKSRTQLAEQAITVFTSWPSFQEMSSEEQAATIAGVRDAISGSCS